MLKTSCINVRRKNSDGIRICIMRRPDEGVDFDVWMPILAPSHEDLTQYHGGLLSQDELFKKLRIAYRTELKKYLDLLCFLSLRYNVTLLCVEEDPLRCHRNVLAEECRRRDSQLQVVIR